MKDYYDIGKIQQWVEEIKTDKYMSRFYPKTFDKKLNDFELYLWFIIVADDYDMGTIWVEKDNLNAEEATLGIFIGIKEKQG